MATGKRIDFLPRGLSRTQAAVYVGVSTSLFDQMVGDGRMPPPREINSRSVWDRHQIDASFDDLPGGVDHVPLDRPRRIADTLFNQGPPRIPLGISSDDWAELTELSKTPGAVVFYRGHAMDRETFRRTVLSKALGKRERDALRGLYDRRSSPGGEGKIVSAGVTMDVLEAWGYVESIRADGRIVSVRITEAGVSAVEKGFDPGPARHTDGT